MVRVYFLIEARQERIHCLLNPEGLVIRRQAGIQPRRSAAGPLTGVGLEDDPLLFTGGGRTQLDLDLLFDVALSGSSIQTEDVRSLTRPLWQLAENSNREGDTARPPLVRFIWGKTWNIPGYVTAVAERLERFTPDGIPQRSWLRLRFVRGTEAAKQEIKVKQAPSLAGITLSPQPRSGPAASAPRTTTLTGGPSEPASPLRPGPAEDLGLTASVVLAADIIAFSLANTNAGRLIGQGLAWMGSRLELAGTLIADWVKTAAGSIANFASTAAGKLADFLGKAIAPLKARIQAWAAPPPSAFMQKIKAGAGAMAAGLGRVFQRLKQAATEAEQALAKLLAPVFEDIRTTLAGVMAATWVVAKAVRAKAAQVLSSACTRIGALSEKIGAAFQSAFQKVPGLAARVGVGVTAALAVIGAALAKVKGSGSTADFHLIPDALAKIAGTVKDLAVSGARGAARIVRKSVEAIARALRNTFSAREAAEAVSKKGTIRQVSASREKLAAALQAQKAKPDPAHLEEAQSALADVQGQVEFLQADESRQAESPLTPALSPSGRGSLTPSPSQGEGGGGGEGGSAPESPTAGEAAQPESPLTPALSPKGRGSQTPSPSQGEGGGGGEGGSAPESPTAGEAAQPESPLTPALSPKGRGSLTPSPFQGEGGGGGERGSAPESPTAGEAAQPESPLTQPLPEGERSGSPQIPDELVAALQSAAPGLEDFEPGQEDAVLAALTPPLEALSAALDQVGQAEDEQTDAQFKAAVSEEGQGPLADLPAPVTRPLMGDRLDQVAYEQYGDPAYWRLLAAFNNISDIFHIPSGLALSIPPAAIVEAK